jgi:hypothetical protein
MESEVTITITVMDADGNTKTFDVDGNTDLDCPYLGWVRLVPEGGYIDLPLSYIEVHE